MGLEVSNRRWFNSPCGEAHFLAYGPAATLRGGLAGSREHNSSVLMASCVLPLCPPGTRGLPRQGLLCEGTRVREHPFLGTGGLCIRELGQVAGKSTGKPSGDIPESEAGGGEAHDLCIAFFGQRRTGSSVGFSLMVPSGSPASGESFSVAPLSTFSGLLFLGSGFIWYWRDSEVPPLPTSRPAPSLGPQWPVAHRMVFRSRACETAS